MGGRKRALAFCGAVAILLIISVASTGCDRADRQPGPSATAVASAVQSPSRSSSTPSRSGSSAALTNRLATSAGPYLKAGAAQPVRWQLFDDDAFRLAQSLDRPILLAVGATWCHWCRVMDEESYGDPATADLINSHFVPVRVDADERPDLDRRYQQAAQMIANEAGWPLTLFLTPEGNVFAGATYLPAEQSSDRPSLTTLLAKLAATYEEQREVIAGGSAPLAERLTSLNNAGVIRGELRRDLVDELARSLLGAFDPENGGFGRRSKVPAPQAIELALWQYHNSADERYLGIATKTLDAMAAGGIRDQLGGGFHRLSLDPRWQVPHFEISGPLNAALAQSYLHAYQITGAQRFRTIAEGTLGYLDRTLADREHGGFFSGQDADVGPGDDGGYYAWDAAEIAALLPPDEAAAVVLYYGVPEPAAKIDGRSASARGTLYGALPVAEVARVLGIPPDEARSKIESGRAHLRAARERRPAPAVDRSFYADRNGLLAVAYLEASGILGRTDLRDSALRAVDRLLALPRQDGLFAHYYVGDRPAGPPLLDDQMAVAAGLLDAFAVTGKPRYLESAGELLDRSIAAFADRERGGFFDVTASPGPGTADFRQRTFDDGPTLGGNPLAAIVLDRYAVMAGNPTYRGHAEQTLRGFAGAAREFGPFASGYALALGYHLIGQ